MFNFHLKLAKLIYKSNYCILQCIFVSICLGLNFLFKLAKLIYKSIEIKGCKPIENRQSFLAHWFPRN